MSSDAVVQAGERRSAHIESLRAIAALGVLAGHVVLFSVVLRSPPGTPMDWGDELLFGGGFGVFLFFALTGYLLFWPFAQRELGGGARVDLRRYAANRALRILPLYVAVVVTVVAIEGAPAATWAQYLTFTQNLSADIGSSAIGATWSLVVEVQFYVLLPWIAWALGRLGGRSLRRAAALVALAGLASLVARYVTVYDAAPVDPRWRFSLPTTFAFFVPGMLLAILRLEWERRRPALLRGPLASSDAWLLASVPLWAVVAAGNSNLDLLLCPASFLAIGACVLPLRRGPATRALAWAPLAAVGVASYSLYLWHVPVLTALMELGLSPGRAALALAGVPLSIVVALVSYRLIEAPFLRLRRGWSRFAASRGGYIRSGAETPSRPRVAAIVRLAATQSPSRAASSGGSAPTTRQSR